jgi:hypothetical protein
MTNVSCNSTNDVVRENEAAPETTITVNSAYSVCFFATVKFFITNQATTSFVRNALAWMRDVALRSLNDANADCEFWSGMSVRQIRIYRKPVVEALSLPFQPYPHSQAVMHFRQAGHLQIDLET